MFSMFYIAVCAIQLAYLIKLYILLWSYNYVI
jgi:hypothetical protein